MMERPALSLGASGTEPRVSFGTLYVLSGVFDSLIVPLLIVAARKRTNGPLIASAVTAFACFAAHWLLSGSQPFPLLFGGPQDLTLALRYLLYVFAVTTGQAAWVLAVYQAGLARRGRWIAALAAAQVVANAVLLYSLNPCIWAEATGSFGTRGCAPPAPLTLHLIFAVWLVSPSAALAYSLRGRLPKRRIAPSGLSVAGPGMSADDGGDADGELEVRAERL